MVQYRTGCFVFLRADHLNISTVFLLTSSLFLNWCKFEQVVEWGFQISWRGITILNEYYI